MRCNKCGHVNIGEKFECEYCGNDLILQKKLRAGNVVRLVFGLIICAFGFCFLFVFPLSGMGSMLISLAGLSLSPVLDNLYSLIKIKWIRILVRIVLIIALIVAAFENITIVKGE